MSLGRAGYVISHGQWDETVTNVLRTRAPSTLRRVTSPDAGHPSRSLQAGKEKQLLEQSH